MDCPAVVQILASVETDVLQRQLRAAGYRDQRAAVRIGGCIRIIASADLRPGGIGCPGGGENIPVIVRRCRTLCRCKGQCACTVIVDRFSQCEVFEDFQLQIGICFLIGLDIACRIIEDPVICRFEAFFERRIDRRNACDAVMTERIKQPVVCVRELGDSFPVADDVFTRTVCLKRSIVSVFLPFGHFEAVGAVDLKFEDTVLFHEEGDAVVSVAFRIVGFHQIEGSHRNFREVNHTLRNGCSVEFSVLGASVRRLGRSFPAVTFPDRQLRISVCVRDTLSAAVGFLYEYRELRIGKRAAVVVQLHKLHFVVITDVRDAECFQSEVGSHIRLSFTVEGKDAVVFAAFNGVLRHQCLGIRHIQRTVPVPEIAEDFRTRVQCRRADQHNVFCAVLLVGSRCECFLHVVHADRNRREVNDTLFKKFAVRVRIIDTVRGGAAVRFFRELRILVQGELRACDSGPLVVLLVEEDVVHLAPVDVCNIGSHPDTGEILTVRTVGIAVRESVAELLQAGCADAGFRCRKLIACDTVRHVLRPYPDGIAVGQFACHVDRYGRSSGIARKIQILTDIVRNCAVDDSRFVRKNIAAEFRAAGKIDSASFLQIDIRAPVRTDRRSAQCGVAVLCEFRTAGNIHDNGVFQIDCAAPVCIVSADQRTARDIERAVCGIHVNCAAVTLRNTVFNAGRTVFTVLQGKCSASGEDSSAVAVVTDDRTVPHAGSGYRGH